MSFLRTLGPIATILAHVLAAPVTSVKRDGLPAPVSAATARTYLAACTRLRSSLKWILRIEPPF